MFQKQTAHIIHKLLNTANHFSNQTAILDLKNKISFTYKELFSLTQNLASCLNCEQKPILISSESSWKLVVSILAVWISRNYFFIMDPRYPKERLNSIIKNLNPSFTLCDEDLFYNFEMENKILIGQNFKLSSHKTLNKTYSLLDKAYIIFTSGSSGTPKGILISHEAIFNVLEYQKEKFSLFSNSKTLHYLNPSFDAFLSELGTTLLSGACFVIHPQVRKSLVFLENIIQQEKITHIFLPPAILGILEPSEKLRSLQVIITGGEPTPKNIVKKWLPYVKFLSAYGPTETTICSHLAICNEEWDNFLGELLPYRKEKLVFLKEYNSYELWLGGNGLAIEYLQNPSETFSKFIWVEGERWYKTGDMVEPTSKGLKFLKRKDTQIKFYGNRLELAEVEKISQNFSEILFCRTFYFNLENQKKLVLVYHANQEISKIVLLNFLKQYLPSSLLPNEIIYLQKPILNSNGKWDLQKVLELVNQKIFISNTQAFQDSLSNLQEEFQLEILNQISKNSFSNLGCKVQDLKKEILIEPSQMDLKIQNFKLDSPFFLLGATGYLGGFFLEECLKKSIKIYLLIRNSYQKEKIFHRLKMKELHNKWNLLEFFIGDASLNKFGLNSKEWEKISEVSKIFNLAGSVNFLLSRQELASKNLKILQNCISLAHNGNSKEIHHVSTLSIFLLSNLELSEITEDSKILETTNIYGGYAQSKWQAEFLLQQSHCKFHIYRLGLLVGDTQNGFSNPKDAFTFFLKCAHLWKDLNLDENLAFDFLPVDLAAKEILKWSEKDNKPSILHIFGDTLYFHELKKATHSLNLSFAPSRFEIQYTQFLLNLINFPFHKIHPLGLFLKTNRKFLSKYCAPLEFNKEILIKKILKNL